MERKKKDQSVYIEPMPRKQFLKLMKEFREAGGHYVADEWSEKILNSQDAEAATLNATTILFKRRPSRATVYEELYHTKQYRERILDSSEMCECECEIEAKQYLLDNAEQLQLTPPEILQTQDLLKVYKDRLSKLKGEKNESM